MKTVICKICAQEVSKRSTLSVDGNRICRDHDEAKKFVADQQTQREVEQLKKELIAGLEEKWKESIVPTLREIKAVNPRQYRMMLWDIREKKGYECANEIESRVDEVEVDFLNAIDSLADKLLKSFSR